jgi:hypothetical protein
MYPVIQTYTYGVIPTFHVEQTPEMKVRPVGEDRNSSKVTGFSSPPRGKLLKISDMYKSYLSVVLTYRTNKKGPRTAKHEQL